MLIIYPINQQKAKDTVNACNNLRMDLISPYYMCMGVCVLPNSIPKRKSEEPKHDNQTYTNADSRKGSI